MSPAGGVPPPAYCRTVQLLLFLRGRLLRGLLRGGLLRRHGIIHLLSFETHHRPLLSRIPL